MVSVKPVTPSRQRLQFKVFFAQNQELSVRWHTLLEVAENDI
jgi:hypothetical protein